MRKDSKIYTVAFALVVALVCGFLVSVVSYGLKERKDANVALDIKKNILTAIVLKKPLNARVDQEEIFNIYKEKIGELVIDYNGNIMQGIELSAVKEGTGVYPLYLYKEKGMIIAYCFPIKGKGLWSTIYGYLALESDAATIRGITFYRHGETPGLGAEIEKEWFQKNFRGKKIWDVKNKKIVPATVIKGKVSDLIPEQDRQFYVDGISGATMTCKGVTDMIGKALNVYEPFFKRIRRCR